jgi:hypothetical protein
MRKTLFLLPVALLALSACNGARNEAAEANESLTGDSNTMGEAVSDVDAANAATDNGAIPAQDVDANASADESVDGNEIME